ncbi:Tho1p LALA0_S01e02344g [Lachancea lanzarotensis]|uniref:LALA0S01e02344g1_1 n=1 Tax=Lachancea lanzarotensis TaxID=1245769 RepID=A0A0C7MX96_9SACH|nr:uncharacterized protein LALA0_S01e02344g [Lachancea lanzarotensis]CEP60070.1 LALA0S01e02344g1_1 [Lachancea lanzarotensis]
MATYAQQTVKQLQKELESRKLSTNGIKKDLIARLEAHDAEKSQPTDAQQEEPQQSEISETAKVEKPEDKPEEAVVPETEEPTTTETPPEQQPIAPVAEHSSDSSSTQIKPKAFSPEEAKAKALEHLQVKLRRARKFADDESTIQSLERQINRIQKFGLDQTTQLAQELGFGKGPENTIARRGNKKSHRKNPKNNNRK